MSCKLVTRVSSLVLVVNTPAKPRLVARLIVSCSMIWIMTTFSAALRFSAVAIMKLWIKLLVFFSKCFSLKKKNQNFDENFHLETQNLYKKIVVDTVTTWLGLRSTRESRKCKSNSALWSPRRAHRRRRNSERWQRRPACRLWRRNCQSNDVINEFNGKWMNGG